MIHENKNIASYFCYLAFTELSMNKKKKSMLSKQMITDDELSNLFCPVPKVSY